MIMAICKNKKCSIGECDQTEGCAAYVPVISNADRIRAMSDEELAKWTMAFVMQFCLASGIENPEWKSGMEEKMVEWLKQPAE
jgi:hypothetical protein